MIGGFPSQQASNAKCVPRSWRHYGDMETRGYAADEPNTMVDIKPI